MAASNARQAPSRKAKRPLPTATTSSLNDIDGITMEGLLGKERHRLRRRRRIYRNISGGDLSDAPARLVPRKYRAAHRRLKNNPYYYHQYRDYKNRWMNI